MKIMWQLHRPEASTTTACDPPTRNSTSRQGDIGVDPVSQRVKRRHLPPQLIALDPLQLARREEAEMISLRIKCININIVAKFYPLAMGWVALGALILVSSRNVY
jgi:hypothetical protein